MTQVIWVDDFRPFEQFESLLHENVLIVLDLTFCTEV